MLSWLTKIYSQSQCTFKKIYFKKESACMHVGEPEFLGDGLQDVFTVSAI